MKLRKWGKKSHLISSPRDDLCQYFGEHIFRLLFMCEYTHTQFYINGIKADLKISDLLFSFLRIVDCCLSYCI